MIHTAVSAPLFFDKKALKMCLIALIITPFCIGQPIEYVQRNISCVEVPDGFNFTHECPERSEISIEANKTIIATALLSSQSFNYSTEVLRMDNYSVITKHCQDLKVTCTIPDEKNCVKEIILDIKIISKPESSDPVDPLKPWGYICISVVLIAVGFGIFCWSYMSCKKEGRQQEATTPGYLQYLLTCFGLRKGTFLAERGEREIRHSEGTELQEVTHGDTETQQNGDVRNVTRHDRDPHGSGENEAGEENPLGNGHVHCIDSKADGKTPQSLGLDHSFWNETIQQTRNDDITAPKVNGESRHRALNRNPKDDDPGGEKSNERKDTIRKMPSGWTVGDHNAEDHETERRPLLPNQRAAIPEFDMTCEATALVNKPGFDPDQVSGCSVAPETDVESTHNMKKN
ncbi:uncharacterized protein LOC111573699 isoform X2 [Amphiprion ocellaris]|uniref:uncharacterized protein LOC111573699 isoform X2 n=1 Tax=Amphiprion ocellaris TaxID=80972 RepID=UPI0024117566|nr:uncharacterized protein LOC111573699 isoform X2 [Amphiprion ocellaris]